MELTHRENIKRRVLRGGHNMYTSTISLVCPFQPDIDILQQDDFFGQIARHWSETVDNGLEGMKHAEY